jgi:hypothetical protein
MTTSSRPPVRSTARREDVRALVRALAFVGAMLGSLVAYAFAI